MAKRSHLLIVFFLVSFCLLDVAYAQWVFLARRALGRIEHLATQSQQGQTHEMAAVLLDADANKVYNTAVSMIREKQNVRIDNEDDASRTIAFSDGQRVISMKVVSLGENVSQIMITSTGASTGEPSGASVVVDAIFRVCKKMNVECSLS